MKTELEIELEEAKKGRMLAEILKLSKDTMYDDRWQTQWGNKTDLGLYRVVKRILEEGQ